MEKHPVALIPITTYDQAAVDTAALQGVDLLGGIARFVRRVATGHEDLRGSGSPLRLQD